jgi:hypothetical protein
MEAKLLKNIEYNKSKQTRVTGDALEELIQ